MSSDDTAASGGSVVRRFDSICEINPKVHLTKGEVYPFIGMADVMVGHRDVHVNEARSFNGSGARFRGGDTLFARITPCLENGKIARAPLDLGVGFGSTEFVVLRARGNECDPGYLYYLSRSQVIRGPAEASMSGASGRQRVSHQAIAAIEAPFPGLEQQRTVAGALGRLDDLIESNGRRVEALEEMARLIYREWFVHFRFPGHEDVELVDSDLGPIPDGWEVPRLAELVATQYGYTESARNEPVGPKFLRGTDMNKTSYIDWSTVPYCPIDASDEERFRIHVGDIFVIRMADPGKVSICETEVDAVFASYLVRLRPLVDRIRRYYLFFTLSDDRYQGWVTGASTGATRKSVSAKVMVEPRIVLPPEALQLQFEEVVGPMRELLTNLLCQNAVLRESRDLLLPRLVSGELDVSELDLESAAAE